MSGQNGKTNGHASGPATDAQAPRSSFLQNQLETMDRPARMVGLFTAKEMMTGDVDRLVEVCRKAMREEDPAASLTLLPVGNLGPGGLQQGFRLQINESAAAPAHDCLLHVFSMDDAASPHRDLLAHLTQMDAEMGRATRESVQPARAFLVLASGGLVDRDHIHPFQNVVALFSSALNALIVDAAAAMVTMDAGEWADALEMSLEVESNMKLLRR